MVKDYYETLGVERSATRDEIKKAYKQLAKRFHPDVNKHDSGAEQKFKEINEAASVLGDEKKRADYDRIGHGAFTQGARGGYQQGGFDFSGFDFGSEMDFGDIFDMFFGGRRRGKSRPRGEDLRHDLSLTLEEVATGSRSALKIRKRELCKRCEGRGGTGVETCRTCHGQGIVREARRTPFGIFQSTAACPQCHGAGETISHLCKECDGTGTGIGSSEIQVDIPAGVEDGMQLRVTGAGDAAPRNGTRGDLYVFITIKEHPLFKRQGNDILLEAPISFPQAAFGDSIEVPILGGSALLKIPAGTQSHTVFRLRGKGVPALRGGSVGDELVTVVIETPKKLTRSQEKALKEYETAMNEQPPYKKLFGKLKEYL